MKNLSKFQIIMISAAVVVLILGIAGWWYTGTLQAEASKRLTQAQSKKMGYERQRYTPTKRTVDILQQNIDQMKATLEPIENEVLRPEEHLLSSVEAMNPTAWKTTKLAPAVDRMIALASKANISLPAVTDGRYFFGYSRYATTATPPADATKMLSKQLLGVEMAFKALAEAGGVRQLLGIRRTFDEDGETNLTRPASSRSGNNSGGGDQLKLNMTKAEGGLYEVFPLEFEFIGDPTGLRGFLNQLAQSPLVYAVRSVTVTTSQSQSPRMSELQNQFASQSSAGTKLLPFGTELITAKVRFDLVDWLGEIPAEDEADTRQAQR